MVALNPVAVALLGLTSTALAAPSRMRRDNVQHPACENNDGCTSSEMCYKPGSDDYPYGLCIPKGQTQVKRDDIPLNYLDAVRASTGFDVLPLLPEKRDGVQHPACENNDGCTSSEMCYKPGLEDYPYGLCIPKGQTQVKRDYDTDDDIDDDTVPYYLPVTYPWGLSDPTPAKRDEGKTDGKRDTIDPEPISITDPEPTSITDPEPISISDPEPTRHVDPEVPYMPIPTGLKS